MVYCKNVVEPTRHLHIQVPISGVGRSFFIGGTKINRLFGVQGCKRQRREPFWLGEPGHAFLEYFNIPERPFLAFWERFLKKLENVIQNTIELKTAYIQGVHKVSLQFKNFITKANGKMLLLNLFYVLSDYQRF